MPSICSFLSILDDLLSPASRLLVSQTLISLLQGQGQDIRPSIGVTHYCIMEVSGESGWTKLPKKAKWRLQYHRKIPISSSKSSTVYYGLIQYEESRVRKQVVIKKYIKPVDNELSQKIRKTTSPHVLRPYPQLIISKEVRNGKEGKRQAELFDYCNGDTLYSLLSSQKLPRCELLQKDVLSLIGQIIKGYSSLHENRITHDDLSLKSIFIHDKRILIGDIGRKSLNMTSQQDFYSVAYTCPESLYRQHYSKKEYTYSKESRDIYSLGLIFFQIIYRNHPYLNEKFYQNVSEQFSNNLHQSYLNYLRQKRPEPFTYNKTFLKTDYQVQLDMVTRMICIDPANRPTYEDVYDAFRTFIKDERALSIDCCSNFLQKNQIEEKEFSAISKESQATIKRRDFSTSSILSQTDSGQNKNPAYISFLKKIYALQNPLIESIKDCANDVRELIGIMKEILEKEESCSFSQDRELLISMTALMATADHILSEIQGIRKEDIGLVKYLLSCHAIFVTKQLLQGKDQKFVQDYLQINEDGPSESLIEQINRTCREYLIPQKVLLA